MSKVKRPWGGWLFCLITIVAGLGCHAIIMAMNFIQGQSFGQDEVSRSIWGFTSVAVDFVGIGLCSAWAGILRRDGEWFQAKKVMGLVVACGLMSLGMFYAYGASNRVEPTRQAALKHSAELTAQAKSEEASRAARQTILGGLLGAYEKATSAGLQKNATTAQRSAAGIQQQSLLAQAPVLTSIEIKATPVEQTPDPGAAALAARINWPVASVQEAWSLALGALLLCLSSTMIRLGFQKWPKREIQEVLAPEPRDQNPYRYPTLTLVPTTKQGRSNLAKVQLVVDALTKAGHPVSNRDLAKLMDCSDNESCRRVRLAGSKINKVKIGREVQISLRSATPAPTPRSFSAYFNRAQIAARESAVKPQSANAFTMYG